MTKLHRGVPHSKLLHGFRNLTTAQTQAEPDKFCVRVNPSLLQGIHHQIATSVTGLVHTNLVPRRDGYCITLWDSFHILIQIMTAYGNRSFEWFCWYSQIGCQLYLNCGQNLRGVGIDEGHIWTGSAPFDPAQNLSHLLFCIYSRPVDFGTKKQQFESFTDHKICIAADNWFTNNCRRKTVTVNEF